jgi:hypothetical protein
MLFWIDVFNIILEHARKEKILLLKYTSPVIQGILKSWLVRDLGTS